MTTRTVPGEAISGGAFPARIVAWQRREGRHSLPWQGTRDPYRVWLSEIMLQQTQVATVIPYYARFLARFPDIAALAGASEDDVLALWSGLGYYSRGRNLHRAAQQISDLHGGAFPFDFAAIQALPGIGRSTAAAVAVFAFGQRRAILDGNVKRVLTRCYGIAGHPGEKAVENRLWTLAESLLPETAVESYTQGLMDLGATLCTRSKPRCAECPLGDVCVARHTGRQADFPQRKARAPLPHKATAMLMLIADGEILLEKRPSTGIWGGLWSLPEIACDDDPHAAARSRFGFEAGEFTALACLQHTFTHFRLEIRALLGYGSVRHPQARQGATLWLPLSDALGAALPTPVRKLLERLEPKPDEPEPKR